jgi:hypothetical protein
MPLSLANGGKYLIDKLADPEEDPLPLYDVNRAAEELADWAYPERDRGSLITLGGDAGGQVVTEAMTILVVVPAAAEGLSIAVQGGTRAFLSAQAAADLALLEAHGGSAALNTGSSLEIYLVRASFTAETTGGALRAGDAGALAIGTTEHALWNDIAGQIGFRGVRNTLDLTEAQIAELRTFAGQLKIGPDELEFVNGVSRYVESFDGIGVIDEIWLGPNVFPVPASERIGRSVFERLTPRAVIAHEKGHMLTSRAGTAFEEGTLLDEVQASLVGRQLPGLSKMERYQLLRDAAERARLEGEALRELLQLLQHEF